MPGIKRTDDVLAYRRCRCLTLPEGTRSKEVLLLGAGAAANFLAYLSCCAALILETVVDGTLPLLESSRWKVSKTQSSEAAGLLEHE